MTAPDTYGLNLLYGALVFARKLGYDLLCGSSKLVLCSKSGGEKGWCGVRIAARSARRNEEKGKRRTERTSKLLGLECMRNRS